MWLELILAALVSMWRRRAKPLDARTLLTAAGVLFSFKTILAVYAGWLPALGH